MKGMLILLGIEFYFFIRMIRESAKLDGFEVFFGFFTFIGLAFLVMNVFNTTFPSISINAGQDKGSLRGFTKESFKSELYKENINRSFVLLSKTNLVYFIFFLLNLIVLIIITIVAY